jgi:hypothetical protein
MLFLPFSKETSAIAGKDMNMNAYKNIGGYISKIQVESYFNRNTVSVDSKGVEKPYATGVYRLCKKTDYIKKKICLLTSLQTEELCKEF